MNLLHKKKTSAEAFSTKVGIIHETHLPSATSEIEMRKLLNRFSSNSPYELLELKVSKQKVILRKENKKILSFKLKELAKDNLISQSDCLIMVVKHRLLIVRFLNSLDLEKFRRRVNGFETRKEGDQRMQSNDSPQFAISENPLSERSVEQVCSTQAGEKSPPYKNPDSPRRQKSLSRFHTPERSTGPRSLTPDVYLVKRTTKHRDGRRKSEYSRITVYNVDHDNFDDASSTHSSLPPV
ncbi:unnamed protein product [Rodentolepis nana]|uniref:RBD domain-containing protein n=1 Tax=Rodentolepis nana TaxID=102285 RepID=A0A0R3TF02_RODNA|nr:unnamed protein product [Rodentolepis nana]